MFTNWYYLSYRTLVSKEHDANTYEIAKSQKRCLLCHNVSRA